MSAPAIALADELTVLVRPARKRDLNDIVDLCAQLGYPGSSASIEKRLRAIRRDRKQQRIFVACLPAAGSSRVVGWIHAFVDRILVTDPRIEIGGLVVDAEHRGLGAGRLLLSAVESWARAKGPLPIVVRSNVLRSEAHLFYEKCGYTLQKQQKVYYKELPAEIS